MFLYSRDRMTGVFNPSCHFLNDRNYEAYGGFNNENEMCLTSNLYTVDMKERGRRVPSPYSPSPRTKI